MTFSFNGPSNLLHTPWLIAALLVLQWVLVLLLAYAVKKDAEKLRQKGCLFLNSPWLWCSVVVIAGGYWPTMVYWLVHYSLLKSKPSESD